MDKYKEKLFKELNPTKKELKNSEVKYFLKTEKNETFEKIYYYACKSIILTLQKDKKELEKKYEEFYTEFPECRPNPTKPLLNYNLNYDEMKKILL